MHLTTAVLAAILAIPADPAAPDLSRYRGSVVVLNYWASWCAPCRKELPALERIHRRYEGRGLTTVGVSIDEPEDRGEARRLARELGISFPLRFDGTTAEMAALGLATAVPATAFIDRDGTRSFRIIGEAKESDLAERVEWLLGDRTAARPQDLVLPPGVTPEHFALHEAGVEEDEHEHHAQAEHAEEEGGSAVPT